MTVKLILLKSGEDIIADVTEMVVGHGEEEAERRIVGYFFDKPCIIKLRELSNYYRFFIRSSTSNCCSETTLCFY